MILPGGGVTYAMLGKVCAHILDHGNRPGNADDVIKAVRLTNARSKTFVVKGKPEHRAEAERLLGEHEAMLAQAQAETDEGTFNASVWVAHNEKMVAGLKKTIAVHDNPEIPDGTVVQT
jgi:hypothetical protein